MFRDCGFRLPCFSRHRGEADHTLNPVLLVTGMGGSILNARKKNTGFQFRVWVRVLFSNLSFKRNLWSIYNKKTGYVESIDPNVEILVPDDDFGLYAMDILDPTWWTKLMNITDLYHFHFMINMLIKCGYEKGTTLFGFPYDFRQSSRIDERMDGLKLKMETAFKASGGKKVDIISHSMGGLIVRCFLSLHPKVFAKYVNKWICIACPFQGAPGCANDSLLTGLQFVYGFESFLFVSKWTIHQLLVECPSIYEVLPSKNFKWSQQPVVRIWRKQYEKKDGVELEVYDSDRCPALFEEALRNNELKYDGKSIALPFNYSVYEWAEDTRRVLSNAQLPHDVKFYNVYGTSLETPFNVSYGSETTPIGDLSEVCHTLPEYTYVDGDKTVPAESAKADGFEAVCRVGVKANHRGLLSDEKVFALIKKWLGVNDKSKHSITTSKVIDMVLNPHPVHMTANDSSL